MRASSAESWVFLCKDYVTASPVFEKKIKGSLEQPHGMNCLHPSLSNLRSGILCKVYNVYLA